jgi:hypothetical protein
VLVPGVGHQPIGLAIQGTIAQNLKHKSETSDTLAMVIFSSARVRASSRSRYFDSVASKELAGCMLIYTASVSKEI